MRHFSPCNSDGIRTGTSFKCILKKLCQNCLSNFGNRNSQEPVSSITEPHNTVSNVDLICHFKSAISLPLVNTHRRSAQSSDSYSGCVWNQLPIILVS